MTEFPLKVKIEELCRKLIRDPDTLIGLPTDSLKAIAFCVNATIETTRRRLIVKFNHGSKIVFIKRGRLFYVRCVPATVYVSSAALGYLVSIKLRPEIADYNPADDADLQRFFDLLISPKLQYRSFIIPYSEIATSKTKPDG